MASDRDVILRELERDGWSVIEHGDHFIAAHDRADQPIKFGGRYGWYLTKIRANARHALGSGNPRRTNRAKQDRQQRSGQHQRVAAARVEASGKTSDAKYRERITRLVVARERELASYARMMRG